MFEGWAAMIRARLKSWAPEREGDVKEEEGDRIQRITWRWTPICRQHICLPRGRRITIDSKPAVDLGGQWWGLVS